MPLKESPGYQGYLQKRELASSPEAELAALEAEFGVGAPQAPEQALPGGGPKPPAQASPPGDETQGLNLKKEPVFESEALAGLNKPNDPKELAKFKVTSDNYGSYYATEALAAQGVGGVMDTIQNIGNTAIDVADYLESYAQKWGLTPQDFIDPQNRLSFSKEVIPESQDPVQQATRSVFRFMAPLGAMGLVSKTSKVAAFAQGTAISAATNFAAFDPHEKRLSNLIQETPSLQNPVAAYLASGPEDSNMEGRFKNMVEGLILDTAISGAFYATMKGYKAMRSVRGAGREAPVAATPLETAAEGAAIKPEIADPEVMAGMEVQPKPVGESTAVVPKPAAAAVEPKPTLSMDPEKLTQARSPEELSKAVTINLEKLAQEDDIRLVVKNFAEENRDRIAQVRRVEDVVTKDAVTGETIREVGSMPIADTQALARDLAMKPEELLSRWKVGKALNAEEMDATRILLRSSAEQLKILADAAKGGGDEAVYAFQQGLHAYRRVHEMAQGASTEIGRALRILREGAQEMDRAAFVREAVNLSGGAGELSDQARLVAEILGRDGADGVQALSKIVKRSQGQTIRDALYETWINGLLSGPKTFVVNTMGNAMMAGSAVLERAVARGIGKIRGADDGVAAGEVGAMWDAMKSEPVADVLAGFQGFFDSIRIAAKELRPSAAADDFVSWEKKGPSDLFSKMEGMIEPAITSQNAKGFKPYRWIQERVGDKLPELAENMDRTVDVLGAFIRLPGRGLQATDQFSKTLSYRAEVAAQATREATRQGLSGEAAAKFVSEFVQDPPEYIKSSAIGFARENTAQAPLQGWQKNFHQMIQNFGADTLGVAPLRAIMPFARTGFNLINFAYDRSPLALASSRFWSDYAAGGARKDLALARFSIGSTFMASSAMLYSQGLLTGNGPANIDAKRMWEAAGNQANSIKIGDTWYSYKRLDPFGAMLGLAADMAEVGGLLGSDSEEDASLGRIIALSAAAVGDAMTPEFLTGAFGDLLDAMNEPEGRTAQRIIPNLAATAIPYSSLLREVRRSGVPFVVEGDMAKRETKPESDLKGIWAQLDEISNKFRANIPGLSKDLPPQRNIFGEAMNYPSALGPDIVSPFAQVKETDSPGIRELVRLGVAGPLLRPTPKDGETNLVIKMPSRIMPVTFEGQQMNFKLSPQQYDRLVMLSAGHGLKYSAFGDRTLRETLDDQVKNNWPQLGTLKNDQNKRLMVKTIVENYRKAARIQLQLEDPSIQDKKRQMQLEALNARTQAGE